MYKTPEQDKPLINMLVLFVLERCNKEFHEFFESPKPRQFVICERVREEATHWERRHEDALRVKFMHRQKRSEVPWPEVPIDFVEFSPKNKRRGGTKQT